MPDADGVCMDGEHDGNRFLSPIGQVGIFAHICREICAQAGKICRKAPSFFDSPAQLEPGIPCVQAANSIVPELLMREAFPTTHFLIFRHSIPAGQMLR